ncbi:MULTISPECIES: hypothetical protein [unclassified Levilactobacillus]|uniref:hypothetical protein n=1 Tax=unclassified Levilactobacillus TaxID=2767918 RepID=UPI002FF354A6
MKQDQSVWIWVVVELTESGELLGGVNAYHSELEARIRADELNVDSYPGASVCRVMKVRLRIEQEEK